MKKTIGYILLVFSFVPWAIIALLPFLEISKGEIAGAATILIVAGQGAFIASIALLGKETWGHIKAVFQVKIVKWRNKKSHDIASRDRQDHL